MRAIDMRGPNSVSTVASRLNSNGTSVSRRFEIGREPISDLFICSSGRGYDRHGRRRFLVYLLKGFK